ncbi:hypothetical protein DRO59_06375 [Candidatus Bathyarchaeota archaeon]|nr:MAG: hypothetical protein DRO59_06375 [Candidatus Bathyarchaeota archaeon]
MTEEEIIKRILKVHPELSRREFMERLEAERKKTGSLISDAALLRMIASELGVQIPQKVSPFKLSIKDLVPSLNDVTVTGRVVAVFPSKTFEGGKSGRLASLLVADKSGVLRVVLWNDKTNILESGELKVGDITRFSHAYTGEGFDGNVELHVGDKGVIEINPKDVENRDYPTISKFATKISEITRKQKRVNTMGTVKELFPTHTFKKRDSTTGKVMRFLLTDETGEITVVVWNDMVDRLKNVLRKGAKLRIINAKVKKGLTNNLEIHASSGTYVESMTTEEELSRIVDLKEGLKHVNVKGEIATKPMFRNVKTSRGENVKLTVFELKDETGRIWVSAWRKHAETASNMKVGDKVIIKDAYVKKGFGNQLEVSTRSNTLLTILPSSKNTKTNS